MVEAFIRTMGTEDDFTGPVNLGNPNEFTIKELAEKTLEYTSSKSEIDFRELPTDDPKQRCPDIQLAKSVLDWQPTIQLEQGLKETINWFKTNCT